MRQWTVDAFASAPFQGNPACVVEPFEAWPDAAWMQALAQENNQPETAFLLKTADPAVYGLRWFTPTLEIRLCGHATLASSHVLFTELGVEAETLNFDTLSGRLTVGRRDGLYEMDFPAAPPHRVEAPDGLAEALGSAVTETWATEFLVAVVEDAATVRRLTPHLSALDKVAQDYRGSVIVAAPSDDAAYDIVDRFFAPGLGVPEDPATGAAHCILAPLFADKLGKTDLKFRQAFPGRGADIGAEAKGDRVLLRGKARTVISSELHL